MKIAILTWVAGTSNYGSILQAYALQGYLSALGFDVTVLDYKPVMDDYIYPSKKCLYYKKITNKIDRTIHRNAKMKGILRRTQLVCDEFVSYNINLSMPFTGINGLKGISNEYDVYICGSDQVWSMNKHINPAYYLDWIPNSKIKISYAPSLPVHNLNKIKIDFLKEKLADFTGISVREAETAKVLNTLTDKTVETVLDPTLLVDKKLWDDLTEKALKSEDRYIVCYFLGNRDFYSKGIEEVRKATGLPVKVIPTSVDSIKLGYEMVENVGPAEFVNLIKNSEYVLTDSYHATIFSVIFHKEFSLFKRFDDKKNDTQNIRIYDLVNKLNLGDRIVDANSESVYFSEKLDYSIVDDNLLKFREFSKQFLGKYLPIVNEEVNVTLKSEVNTEFDTVYADKSKCSGCAACHDGCPVHAIDMVEDEYGYKYPSINHDACIKCGKCKRICPLANPVKNEYKKKSYIAATKDCSKSEKSSSGGVFPLLCEAFLKNDGVVYGAEISKHSNGFFYVSHVGVDSLENVEKLYNSKYIQSNTAGIYADVKEKLLSGKDVLFSGTPCQINGLKNYLGKDYTNLYTTEVICHGVPSHKIFHKYQELLNSTIGGTITNIVFRDKAKGWDKNINIFFKDKCGLVKNKIIPFYKSSYFMMFLKGDILRDSCFSCPFASRTRGADITLGDYWGAEYEHPSFVKENGNKDIRKQGMSCVIVNSDKGRAMLDKIKNQLVIEESSYEKIALHNKQLLFHLPVSKNRDRYLSQINDKDYAILDRDVLDRYGKISKKSYIKNNLTLKIKLLLDL
ncbi:4Fe-4S dicluster domain-containing protein [Pseudobutyrivibrio sp. ACV-2]|uniref:polysaccharide pyruvyl transferase family protein n=1 Tax=Pseudobutyrivibrio sp. ACV-2 TaxID=1520801 RepID=UPI00089AA33A|nr:polysaccharide pyruvyl transferase family protein [Pseudobutyrivibrio sp. ACV-2]SEA01989.1 4Fe-4S dicluster domain-containing protein [Pseudobutyrivibrio sp. ACV-2]